MKKTWIAALLLILAFGMTLTACKPSDQPNPSQPKETTTTAVPTAESTTFTSPELNLNETEGDSDLSIKNQGKLRIPYTVNRSSVQYVTNADQLPDYAELAGYDDAYFQDHALLLVVETVSSGSAQVGIQSINIEGSTAAVTLSHEMQGTGTTDMATWLLWAEVEPGLNFQWSVSNPALPSATQTH